MNQLTHVFLTYFILSFIIPEVHLYFWPIALFSFILDFDHVPSYILMLFKTKAEKAKMKVKDYVTLFRTPIQEPIGILTIELMFLLLYFCGLGGTYLLIASLSIFIHWIIDFLTVHTQPFQPIDKRIVCLFFKTGKQRIWSEIVITLISFVLFLLV